MKSVIFNIREDYNGYIGLLYKDAPDNFDAITHANKNALSILAHDILEHDILKDDGSIEAEFRAIGAAMYGRGNHEQLNFRGDFVSMAINALQNKLQITPTNKGIKKFDPIEWIIDKNEFCNNIKEELQYYDSDITMEQIRNFVKIGVQYCRIGARRAAKFYDNNPYKMYNQFTQLVNEAYNTCRYMEEWDSLKISWNSNKIKLTIINPKFY